MSLTDTCPHAVVRKGHDEPCDRPATGGVRVYEFEGEEYTEATCDRHAQRFPLSDAIGRYGQWLPLPGSFLLAGVTSC